MGEKLEKLGSVSLSLHGFRGASGNPGLTLLAPSRFIGKRCNREMLSCKETFPGLTQSIHFTGIILQHPGENQSTRLGSQSGVWVFFSFLSDYEI